MTNAFQTISQTAEVVRKELDNHGIQGRVYVLLTKLRKRKKIFESEEKMVEANTEATGVLDKGNSSTSKFDGNSGQKVWNYREWWGRNAHEGKALYSATYDV
ncbi:uncharacterized protein [Fopius arisanus]|uniref:Uncharacterized protein n=1 Tax=Fopius arisanus TaxID=64838 RepID=A0A9R1UAP5_9HYME|nr:PREDICTED: uncharacterized protein LOC105273636 [Fopius arisanus]